jgi:cytochrome c553
VKADIADRQLRARLGHYDEAPVCSAALMKSAVAKLSQEDMIALAAYISSLDP